ncbi:ABC transporter substrate-binding protein [Lederbergia panacisoli]|uniref:ABC transporter substrate-binding protein n=1 Tax=Lederbergia panacisoli TaxID=1255251 RepID=UPI00214AD565|nr:ABC transporter substrate-binding protein [Lederbergia panacisoli]MCR2822987.1 ABC transporter substrate-binding protein [Lederbergia panacisoli]
MRKIKSLCLISLVFSLLLLTACGSPSSETGSKGKSNENEKVTLNVWFPGTGTVETAVRDILDKFEEENPNIKVELEAIPWGEYFQKLSVGYAGGTAPDVHGLGYGQLIFTVMQDQYMDLNQFIEKDNWEGKDDVFESILKAGQYKDGQYGLLFPEVRPLVWRKDFFEEVGLDPEQPPQTLDEVFEYAKKLKVVENGETTRAGIDIQTENGEQSYFSLLMLLGQDIDIYEENGNPRFDESESIELVKKMVDLFNDGAIIPSHQQQLQGSNFENDLAAMSFASSPTIETLANAVGHDNIGWSLPPKGPNGDQTALMLGTFLTMNKNTKHPEESWELIKFWFNAENALDFSKQTGFAVPLKSLENDFKELAPQNEIVFEALMDARGYSPTEHWSKNMDYLRLALEESYNGIRPVDEAFKENAKLLRKELGLE